MKIRLAAALVLYAALAEAAGTVRYAGADIPVMADVDVVVVGGASGGVAAAVAARAAGASVYVVAPRPFLGDDLAAKLHLENDLGPDAPALAREIFDPAGTAGALMFGDVTPMRIKRTMDRALLDAKVPFVTWTFACDVLRDAKGEVAGVVTASRSGLGAVVARVVVDATERGAVARAAGAEFSAFPDGPMKFARRVISGQRPSAPGLRCTALGPAKTVPVGERGERQSFAAREIDATLWRCEYEVVMKDGSARSFAEADQVGRDLTWTPTLVEAADTVEYVAPDHVMSADYVRDPLASPGELSAACFRSRNRANVFVAGMLGDLPRETAARLAHADWAIAAGERIGRAAAQLARDRGPAVPGDRSGEGELPTLAACDVFVAGAGTGGAPAAIAAARAGAKVIVSDYLERMGGVMTEGLIGLYCYGLRIGFTGEMDAGVRDFGAIYSQCKSEWMRQEARKAGAEIWFQSLVVGVVKDGDALTGVIVAMADGTRGIVRARAVVDATGNADVAALAGEDTEFINGEELSLQGTGSTPRILGTSYQNTDSGFVDDTDAADLCFFSLRARESFGTYVWDQSQAVNSRERRRLHGVAYITAQDVMNNRTYPDVVVQTRSNFDTHGQTVSEQFFIEAPHAAQAIVVNVPYRAFLPRRADALLVIGLGMSAHRDAMPILRMQPDVQNQGYAAGYAAATAVRDGVRVRDVDIRKVQRHLVEKGIVPADALKWTDSFPLPDAAIAAAVRTIPDAYRGLAQVLSDVPRSAPLLRAAYGAAKDDGARLAYAHVLGLTGDATGAEALLTYFAATNAWDAGWNYQGMDQFGRSVSWVDSYMIALGRTRDRRALEPVLRLAKLLGPKSRYSHYRAVALAAESIGDRSAAPVLAALLKLPGVGGHSIDLADGGPIPKIAGYDKFVKRNLGVADAERSDCLRELCLARALFRCGDADGLGRRTLEAYAADPRRAYANHALKVLGSR